MDKQELSIKMLREKAGLTQQEFSKATFGIPVRTIQNWEGGQRNCSEPILKLLEFKLRVDKFIP